MKTPLITTVLAAFLFASTAEAAVYMKYEGVKGNSATADEQAASPALLELDDIEGESRTSSQPARATSSKAIQTKPQECVEPDEIDVMQEQEGVEPDEIDVMEEDDDTEAGPAFMEFDTIKGESKETSSKPASQASVEREKTIQTAPQEGVEPDEIDVAVDPEPLMPDFGILLGGGGASDEAKKEENRLLISDVLLKEAQAKGKPVEQVSMNFEKIKVKVRHSVKLFGFIPVDTSADVEIDAEEKVEVHFPWWSFLASGKQKEEIGQDILTTLADIIREQTR